MNHQQTQKKTCKISPKRKAQLIKGVLQQGKSIIYITKKLRLNYTTARMIINQQLKNGVSELRNNDTRENFPVSRSQVRSSQEIIINIEKFQQEKRHSSNQWLYPIWTNLYYPEPQQMNQMYFYPFYPLG